jgi:ATP phosphoribosyltransferase regulatory subunit
VYDAAGRGEALVKAQELRAQGVSVVTERSDGKNGALPEPKDQRSFTYKGVAYTALLTFYRDGIKGGSAT